MSTYGITCLVVLLIVLNCFLPIAEGGRHHKKHFKKFNRRSNDGSSKVKVIVNRTVINITTTSSNTASANLKEPLKPKSLENHDQAKSLENHDQAKSLENHDPELKSVNAPVEGTNNHAGQASGGGISKTNNVNANVNHNLPPSPIDKVVPSNTIGEQHLLDTEVFKSLLRDLVSRLDRYESSKQTLGSPLSPPPAAPIPGSVSALTNPILGGEGHKHINSLNARHCILHGLWLSTVAGAAIELVPEQQQGHIEIQTRIFELPDNPYPPLINSQWTGKGIISQESPTTLTIVFQEHINTGKENHAKERGLGSESSDDDSSVVIQLPRTAVFVGQCLVCEGNPTLQGAWVVFPASQTCTSGAGFIHGSNGAEGLAEQKSDSIRMTTPDAIYLLRYY